MLSAEVSEHQLRRDLSASLTVLTCHLSPSDPSSSAVRPNRRPQCSDSSDQISGADGSKLMLGFGDHPTDTRVAASAAPGGCDGARVAARRSLERVPGGTSLARYALWRDLM